MMTGDVAGGVRSKPRWSMPTDSETRATLLADEDRPAARVVIVGGGFGGLRAIEPDDAEGETLRAYQDMIGERPEDTSNLIKSTSIRPRTMKVMRDHGNVVNFQNFDSGLSRLQLEMIAPVVSTTLECRY